MKTPLGVWTPMFLSSRWNSQHKENVSAVPRWTATPKSQSGSASNVAISVLRMSWNISELLSCEVFCSVPSSRAPPPFLSQPSGSASRVPQTAAASPPQAPFGFFAELVSASADSLLWWLTFLKWHAGFSRGDEGAAQPQALLSGQGLGTDAQGPVHDRLRKGHGGPLPGVGRGVPLIVTWWFVGWRASGDVCILCNQSQWIYQVTRTRIVLLGSWCCVTQTGWPAFVRGRSLQSKDCPHFDIGKNNFIIK